MKPLLKWAGGKRYIADELFSYFPVDWNKGTYIEPFIGGGALMFATGNKNAKLYIPGKNILINEENGKEMRVVGEFVSIIN